MNGAKSSVLLLGLISIVGLALLTYSFEFFLVFLIVLFASLLTRIPFRKFLLDLQRRPVASVGATFWGSMTIFFVSVFCLIAYIYFEEELPSSRAEEILIFTAVSVALISILVDLIILVFLRSKTGFPRWTANLSRLLAIFFGSALLIWLTFFTFMFGGPSPPLDAFEVSYRAKIVFLGKLIEVEEEYEIQPKSDYVLINVDDEWLSRTPGVSIKNIHSFRMRESVGGLTGLLISVRREMEADITRVGLLRRKLILSNWDLQVQVKYPKETFPSDENGIFTFPLKNLSRVSGKFDVRLPKNSYLGSFPEGKLVKLPDRDQFILEFAKRRPELELYYLPWFRFGMVRSVLSDSSVPDIALKAIAFVFWPVILLVLAVTQRSLGDSLVKVIKRDPQRRRAGF